MRDLKRFFYDCYCSGAIAWSGQMPGEEVDYAFEVWWINNEERIVKGQLEVKGYDIVVKPVTRDEDDGQLIWERYNGWWGTVIGKTNNGDLPAVEVRITNDGTSFIEEIINTTDIIYGRRRRKRSRKRSTDVHTRQVRNIPKGSSGIGHKRKHVQQLEGRKDTKRRHPSGHRNKNKHKTGGSVPFRKRGNDHH